MKDDEQYRAEWSKDVNAKKRLFHCQTQFLVMGTLGALRISYQKCGDTGEGGKVGRKKTKDIK